MVRGGRRFNYVPPVVCPPAHSLPLLLPIAGVMPCSVTRSFAAGARALAVDLGPWHQYASVRVESLSGGALPSHTRHTLSPSGLFGRISSGVAK